MRFSLLWCLMPLMAARRALAEYINASIQHQRFRFRGVVVGFLDTKIFRNRCALCAELCVPPAWVRHESSASREQLMDPNLIAKMMPSFSAGVPPFVAFNQTFSQVPVSGSVLASLATF